MKTYLVENQGRKTTSENPKQLRAEGNGMHSQISGAVVITKSLGRGSSLRDRTQPKN